MKCGKDDHVSVTQRGKRLVNYISCENFVKMRPQERFVELKNKGRCLQCLNPGAKQNHKGVCCKRYSCQHDSLKRFDRGLHVLVCEWHKDDPKNKELFDEYKERFITNSKSEYNDFSKNISLSFHAGALSGSYSIRYDAN